MLYLQIQSKAAHPAQAPQQLSALQTKFNNNITTGWTSYVSKPASANIAFNTSVHAFIANITNAGTANWNIQLYCNNCAIVAGRTYYYTVNLTSTLAREMWLAVQPFNSNTPYFLNSYKLSVGNNTITGKFIAPATMPNAHFILYLGTTENTILPAHTINLMSVSCNTTEIKNLTPLEE